MVLFGVAVFLIFVLVAGETAGALGRGTGAGLSYAFGRLAFLLPLTLLALAVTSFLDVRLRHSYWLVGALVFLFGLFLLVAAGFPPFGSHPEATFTREVFEVRAGGLGEALFALFRGAVGTVGVAVLGWVTLLAGFSLATGVTARRLGRGTRRAAGAVVSKAEQSTLVMRARDARPRFDEQNLTSGGRSRDGFGDLAGRSPQASAPHLGPRDLVGDGALSEVGCDGGAGTAGTGVLGGIDRGPESPFGAEFDDWDDGRTAVRSPLAPLIGGTGGAGGLGGGGLVDGAQAYADIFSSGGTAAVASGGMAGATIAGSVGAGTQEAGVPDVQTARGPGGGSGPGAAGRSAGAAEVGAQPGADSQPGSGAEHTDEPPAAQETLPGLARAPRQIALPVEEPAYMLPETHLLRKSTPASVSAQQGERDTANVLLHALAQFGVEARLIGMVVGPRVTRYELQLAPGTKVSRVTNLKDDLAYALASTEIRILAPIPGKSAVGVEVPNQRPDFVTLGDIYREFPKSAGPLMVWLGKDISGKPVYADLTRMPHLLIAGTTGSGKSGCVNCLVSSILLRSTPEQIRFIMIDPKKVELSHYDRIPHLLVPVVTNMKDAAGVLHNVCKEMEDRYELMELEHARNLGEMNKARARRGERALPYIVVVIDELADLMMVSPQEVEEYVIRLAQKSRAVGIHLVVATQRPSADVITGMIKANIPSRIAFAVSSQIDSRVILDVNGAETLLGMGDMLFKPLGASHLQRVQGAYITEEEIAILVNHWRHQAEPEFREELLRRPPDPKKGGGSDDDMFDPDEDDLLVDAARLVIETGSASVSMLQRRLRVGYTRAGRLIDMLERRGIVGPWEGSKPRQILIEADDLDHVLAGLDGAPLLDDGDDGTAGD